MGGCPRGPVGLLAGMASRPSPAYLGLALGVAAVSSAAVLIRLAEAPPLAVAFYRVALAWGVLMGVAGLRGGPLLPAGGRERLLVLASGLALALHFALWIASLGYTSVASSVLLVTANPLLTALLERAFLGEPLRRRTLAGILLGLAGAGVLAGGDWRLGPREALGDLLAGLGALAIAAYYTLGRRLRGRLPLIPYLVPVYGSAGLFLGLGALVLGTPLGGFPPRTWLLLALVGLVPQLVGHSSLNWALGRLPATRVASAVMLEPVAATLLAWGILNETPPATALAGGALVIAGVYLALRP